jgi:hypothetical protein
VVTKFLNWLNVLKQKLDSVSSRIFLWDFLYISLGLSLFSNRFESFTCGFKIKLRIVVLALPLLSCSLRFRDTHI